MHSNNPVLHWRILGVRLPAAGRYTFLHGNECRPPCSIYGQDCLKRSILFGEKHLLLIGDNHETDVLHVLLTATLSKGCDPFRNG